MKIKLRIVKNGPHKECVVLNAVDGQKVVLGSGGSYSWLNVICHSTEKGLVVTPYWGIKETDYDVVEFSDETTLSAEDQEALELGRALLKAKAASRAYEEAEESVKAAKEAFEKAAEPIQPLLKLAAQRGLKIVTGP
jgi:hypothetical protein